MQHGWSNGTDGMMAFPMGLMVIVPLLLLVGIVLLVIYLRRPVVADAAAIRGAAVQHLGTAAVASETTASTVEGERDAFLVIPDISGYTRFLNLNRFALGHAQYAITELLKSMIEAAGDELWPAKVEGDAILLCGWRQGRGAPEGLTGERVAGRVAALVTAFYRKRMELQNRNVCACGACTQIDQLDLKVVVHSGPVLSYDLSGRCELSGVPVIVAHRLLKNILGLTSYVLVTEAAHQDVRPQLQCAPSDHLQDCEGIGSVQIFVYGYDPTDFLPKEKGEVGTAKLGAKAGDGLHKLRSNLRPLGPVTKPRPRNAA